MSAWDRFVFSFLNVEVARQILIDEGIPVTAEDVDGERGRKLIFQTHDGAAWVRSL